MAVQEEMIKSNKKKGDSKRGEKDVTLKVSRRKTKGRKKKNIFTGRENYQRIKKTTQRGGGSRKL